MGATLKRRDGSGRVVCGLEPDVAVISFNVFCTKFSGGGGKVTVYQESQTFARKQAAVAWAKRRETELAEPDAIECASRVGHTVKQMIDRYLGEKGDSDNFVKQSQNRLGSSLILTIGTGLVSE